MLNWLIFIILNIGFLFLTCINGYIFWKGYVKKQNAGSWIPLIGGTFGVIAFLISPISGLQKYWWLPLIIDMGSLPGMLQTLYAHTIGAKKTKL